MQNGLHRSKPLNLAFLSLLQRGAGLETHHVTAVNPTKTLHVCLISATLLPLLGGTSQDINELIRQAEQRRDWKAVGELQLTIINRNGYHFGNAASVIHALSQQGRTDEAIRLARSWCTTQNEPACWASLADAYLAASKFPEARTELRRLKGYQPSQANAATYLDELIERAAIKRYELMWFLNPADTAKMKAEWYAPPQNSANQRLIELKVTGGSIEQEGKNAEGSKIVLIKPEPGARLEARAVVDLWPTSSVDEAAKSDGKVPAGMEAYLGKSPGIDPQDPRVQAFAANLSGKSFRQRVEAVMLHANTSLTYCPPGSPPGLDRSTDVIARGGGHCEALSMTICAYLRATGVPARMIRGHSAVFGKQGVMKQHTIPEIFIPGVGWRDWDHLRVPFLARDNFVRHGSYNGAPVEGPNPNMVFQGREFNPDQSFRNGPYRFRQLSRSLEEPKP